MSENLGGPGISSQGLDERRRRLLFRSWHRGIREMDIVYGQFADVQIASLSDADLDVYAQLLELPDQQVFEWGDRRASAAGRLRHAAVPAPARILRRRDPDQVSGMVKSPAELLRPGKALTLAQVADGAEGLVLADLARAVAARPNAPAISLAVVCRDGQRMAALSRALAFFGPDILTMEFPAWTVCPYDRVSPNASVVAQRMTALSRLTRIKGRDKPSVLLTTVNAALQRVPAREFVATHALSVAPGNVLGMHGVVEWLELNGFTRASTVREPGEYAVRGGILDLFPPGKDMPVRFDFFGDSLETIRSFDPETQRSEMSLGSLDLVPVAEFQLITETIRRFRTGYVAAFGAATPDDLLYEAVSEGRRYPGMEHWLPLFHTKLETLFDYLPGTPLTLETLADDAARERFTQITDYYDTRKQALKAALQTPAAGQTLPGRSGMGETRRRRRGRQADALRRAPRRRGDRRRRACRPQFHRRARGCRRQRVRGGQQARAGVAGRGQARGDRAVERGRARAHEPRPRRP